MEGYISKLGIVEGLGVGDEDAFAETLPPLVLNAFGEGVGVLDLLGFGDGRGVLDLLGFGDGRGVLDLLGFGDGRGVLDLLGLGDGRGLLDWLGFGDGRGVLDLLGLGDGRGVLDLLGLGDGRGVLDGLGLGLAGSDLVWALGGLSKERPSTPPEVVSRIRMSAQSRYSSGKLVASHGCWTLVTPPMAPPCPLQFPHLGPSGPSKYSTTPGGLHELAAVQNHCRTQCSQTRSSGRRY